MRARSCSSITHAWLTASLTLSIADQLPDLGLLEKLTAEHAKEIATRASASSLTNEDETAASSIIASTDLMICMIAGSCYIDLLRGRNRCSVVSLL
jgi:hypothetical protein